MKNISSVKIVQSILFSASLLLSLLIFNFLRQLTLSSVVALSNKTTTTDDRILSMIEFPGMSRETSNSPVLTTKETPIVVVQAPTNSGTGSDDASNLSRIAAMAIGGGDTQQSRPISKFFSP